MAADFWAGYFSGAVGILIGNPLDIIKTRLQAGSLNSFSDPIILPTTTTTTSVDRLGALVKGSAAPILGYGALNALMFMTYNRSMGLLSQDPARPTSLFSTWIAGAVAGLTTFVVSAPTELIKCRAQVSKTKQSSLDIAKEIWKQGGIRGLYLGGGVTSIRDSVGYGFYFWSYELSKQVIIGSRNDDKPEWMSVLLCGGIAGVVTWASVFPLDVIKTRVQVQSTVVNQSTLSNTESSTLLQHHTRPRSGAVQIAKEAYRTEGISVFFRGLGVCSARAFIVNAVQWAVYEWMMLYLLRPIPKAS